MDEKEGKCRICGCTDNHACPEGCFWVEDDLCSECAIKLGIIKKELGCENCGEKITEGKQYYALFERGCVYCSIECLINDAGQQGIVDEDTIEEWGVYSKNENGC